VGYEEVFHNGEYRHWVTTGVVCRVGSGQERLDVRRSLLNGRKTEDVFRVGGEYRVLVTGERQHSMFPRRIEAILP